MNIWIILVILGFLGLVIVIADILQNGLSIGSIIGVLVVIGIMIFGIQETIEPVKNQAIREAKTALTVKQAKKVFNQYSSDNDVLNALSGKSVREGKQKYIINIKKGGFLQENNISFEPIN